MVTVEDFFIQLGIAFGSAIIIGLIIRFRFKPKHEEIFEKNRSVEIKRLFNSLHWFDHHFENFHEILTNEMGEISRDKKRVTPEGKITREDGSTLIEFNVDQTKLRMKWDQGENNVVNKLQFDLNNMKQISETQRTDYPRLLNNIENPFIVNVLEYINDSYQWSESAVDDYLMKHLLEKRIKSANKIIDFVKNDKTLDLEDKYTKEFIEKWEREFPRFNSLFTNE